jgi:Domain of unknown function (DUF4258)
MPDKPLLFSKHAQDMVEEREIPVEWIRRALSKPVFEEPDRHHIGATRAYAPIAEFGDRILRVVYYDTGTAVRVITLFFDWRATRGSRMR